MISRLMQGWNLQAEMEILQVGLAAQLFTAQVFTAMSVGLNFEFEDHWGRSAPLKVWQDITAETLAGRVIPLG